jgi:hypothetical protein
MCFTLGASIAEIVSAYPTCGGLYVHVPFRARILIQGLTMFRYTASAQLCPKRHRARVGWVVGWLNILGKFFLLSH